MRSETIAICQSPWGTLRFSKPRQTVQGFSGRSLHVDGSGREKEFPDPWAALRSITPAPGELPSWCGFLSYELLHEIERVPNVTPDNYGLPLYEFTNFESVELIADSRKPIADSSLQQPADCSQLTAFSNFTRAQYCQAVEVIRESIRCGDVYQVNLSQQFRLPFTGSAARLYDKVVELCAPRYGAYLELVGGAAIVSASPELFLSFDGERLRSSPIKGTRARGSTAENDAQLRAELLSSEKDLAELAMIVDLVRNDMGRVAAVGSVRVDAYPRLETLPHVHHLVADISCEMESSCGLIEILKALFPCGSVTGAPKIAAMQQIAELERTRRGVYTGAIGFLGPSNQFQLNVAIRSGLVHNGQFIFQAGGGW